MKQKISSDSAPPPCSKPCGWTAGESIFALPLRRVWAVLPVRYGDPLPWWIGLSAISDGTGSQTSTASPAGPTAHRSWRWEPAAEVNHAKHPAAGDTASGTSVTQLSGTFFPGRFLSVRTIQCGRGGTILPALPHLSSHVPSVAQTEPSASSPLRGGQDAGRPGPGRSVHCLAWDRVG